MGDAIAVPVGEGADRIGGRGDRLEVVDVVGEWQIDVEVLLDLKGRDDIDGDGGDDTKGPEADHRAVEVGIATLQAYDIARGGDELKTGDSCGEVLVRVARTVRCGADGAGDRDVRQRGEVAEREAIGMEARRELAIGHATVDGDGARGGVEAIGALEALE